MVTAAEYEAELFRYLVGQYAVRDAWIGPWQVRKVPTKGATFRYQADHPSSVGATASDVATLAQRMATWDAGIEVMQARGNA